MARPSPARAASALALAAGLLAVPAPEAARAQDSGASYTFYGTPGLLEMPTATSAGEGEVAGTVSFFGGQLRNSFTAQVTPRFSGTFRYSRIDDYEVDGEAFYDRSFDLRFRFNDEGRLVPAVAVGLQDFLGTGIYSGEYVVATKTIGDAFRVTGGLGWGRFGSYGGFSNPLGILDDRFETRPDTFEEGVDTGGEVGAEAFFRGDAALFGGVEYAPNERFILKAEYSSDDAYDELDGEPLFERASPLNFGVAWRPFPGVQLTGAYMYGSQLAFGATIAVNANQRPFGAGLDTPPQPVAVRAAGVAAAGSWDRSALPGSTMPDSTLAASLQAALRTEGVDLRGLEVTDRAARVRYANTRFRAEAQALGRVARILTQELPPSVETITLEPVQAGIPLSAVTLARSDLEALENEVGGAAAILDRARFDDAGPAAGLTPVASVQDRFTWGLRPYFGLALFEAGERFRLSFGAELSAAYRIRPDLVLSGSLRQAILSSESDDDEDVEPIGGVPVVRRNSGLYGDDGHPVIDDLTLAHYGRPGRNLYSRVTVGLLEYQYGGVSAEILWKPVESRLGLGVEVNHVQQRDYDQLFGFRDYEVTTGHASAYLDLGNGFHTQLDVGRYLAGDYGATFTLDREFENGWRVGGYFSLTDIPFEDYGEGSFDKGVRLTIPTDFILGRPTRRENSLSLASLNRDGGARLEVDGRLYETVRDGHLADLEDSWGRFWR